MRPDQTSRRFPARASGIGLLTIVILITGLPVLAQGADQGSDEDTKKVPSMTEAVYKELGAAQQQTEENNYSAAVSLLDKLSRKELNSYERAQVLNLYAFVYYSQEQYPKAIKAYEDLLVVENLPEAMEQGTIFTLAQLYFTTESWRKAINLIDRWFALTDNPGAKPWELKAQAHYQLQEYREAVQAIKEVIALTRKDGKPVKEHSYLLLRVLYFELEDHRQVATVLQDLIRYYPKEQYWLHLASTFSELGDQKKQLGAMELAYLQGFLDTESEVISLAGLLLQNDLPFRAGKVLQKGIDDGILASKLQNWRLLSQAWTLAQEDDRAIPALQRAAELSPNGEPYILLAQSFINLERWDDAAQAVRAGLSKGGLSRPDQAQIMLGQIMFEKRSFGEARAAFQAAQSDNRSRQLAGQWLNYVNSEEERRAELQAALE